MTNKEKFIEVMNQTFDAGFTKGNFVPNSTFPNPIWDSAMCTPCGFYQAGACEDYTCEGCKKWWDKEYKEANK